MAKAKLRNAVCTVAMLAALPAFAQSNNPPSQTGGSGMPQSPPGQATAPATAAPPASNTASPPPAPSTASPMPQDSAMQHNGSMAPAGDNSMPAHHPMHHARMSSHSRQAMRSGRNDASQNAEVDRLNEQSYRAAQQGQAFSSAGSMNEGASGGMHGMSNGSMPASGSGGMHDMSMPPSGTGGNK